MGFARKNLISLQDTPYYWWKRAPAFLTTWMWGMQVLQELSPATISAIHGGHTASLVAFGVHGCGA